MAIGRMLDVIQQRTWIDSTKFSYPSMGSQENRVAFYLRALGLAILKRTRVIRWAAPLCSAASLEGKVSGWMRSKPGIARMNAGTRGDFRFNTLRVNR